MFIFYIRFLYIKIFGEKFKDLIKRGEIWEQIFWILLVEGIFTRTVNMQIFMSIHTEVLYVLFFISTFITQNWAVFSSECILRLCWNMNENMGLFWKCPLSTMSLQDLLINLIRVMHKHVYPQRYDGCNTRLKYKKHI